MSETSGYRTRAPLDPKEQEKGNKQRLLDFLLQISDSLKLKAGGRDVLSDRDALAEKAMMAYIVIFAEKDYSTIAAHAYRMADAMIAESHERQP